MQTTDKSTQLYARAQELIPGGVNSPVRAFGSVGLSPRYIHHGKGSHIWDIDGNEYIDFIGSWGPLLLGHSHPKIKQAIAEELEHGTSYGACNPREVEMAELICSFFPSIEMVRMVNSGTEATMSAIRLARGYTGKDKIIKFEGCYHGHADSFLIQAGSGLATLGTAGSSGITQKTVENTLVATYNDIDSVKHILQQHRGEVAALILEPILGNMGLIPPSVEFLRELRQITEEEGVLLIFDEVISGFRASKGGAQELYSIRPDLTCLGKIIGGGLPVGAFGGKREIMQHLAPLGPVYQAGTLSGNPLALAAGIAMLDELGKPSFHDELETKGALLQELIRPSLEKYQDYISYNRIGSLSTLFFKAGGVSSYSDAKQANTELYARYFGLMLERGIYLPPSQFECMFISSAHSQQDIKLTAQTIRECLDIVLGS